MSAQKRSMSTSGGLTAIQGLRRSRGPPGVWAHRDAVRTWFVTPFGADVPGFRRFGSPRSSPGGGLGLLGRELQCGAASEPCGDSAWTGAFGGWLGATDGDRRQSGSGEGVDERPGHAPSAVRLPGADPLTGFSWCATIPESAPKGVELHPPGVWCPCAPHAGVFFGARWHVRLRSSSTATTGTMA